MKTRYGVPVGGDEKEVLEGFLKHYRTMILQICEGLSEEDLRRPMVPSGTSLLGLVKHLSYVEYGWFPEAIENEDSVYPYDLNDPIADFRIEQGETSDHIFDLYRRACDRSRRVLDNVSLDDELKNPTKAGYNVRWVLVNMIVEVARHAGHADIMREQIDGRIGTGYVRESPGEGSGPGYIPNPP